MYCYAYLNKDIDGAQDDDESVDAVFPVSIFEFIRSPEGTPVEDPDEVGDQGDDQEPCDSGLLVV